MKGWLLRVLLVALAIPTTDGGIRPHMSPQIRLLKYLLADYSYTSMRPVCNITNTTTVQMLLVLTEVIELSEKYQTIEIGAWMTQTWTDEYMTWDPNDHEGVDHVYVHKSMIWLPDITLYKNVDRNFESYKDIPVHVTSTGKATWGTPAILKCTCLVDARLFPFDTQVCHFRFTSWAYDVTEINLTELGAVNQQSFYTDVGVWELVSVTVVRQDKLYEDGRVFPDLIYSIRLKRRPLFHVLQILLPCVLLSLLNLMVFVLPPESGERISLGVTNLLSLVLFQQLISGQVPPTSDKASIIGYYFTPMIFLACASVVSTVAVLNVFYRDKRRPIPRWVRCVIFDILARLVCHHGPRAEVSPKSEKSRAERVLVLPRDGTGTAMTTVSGSAALMTGDAENHPPSRASYRRVGHGEDAPVMNTITCGLGVCCGTGTKPRASPVVRTRRKARQGEAVARRGRHQAGKPSDVPHTWREVALVIDRTALILSFLTTLTSMLITAILFIVTFLQTEQ